MKIFASNMTRGESAKQRMRLLSNRGIKLQLIAFGKLGQIAPKPERGSLQRPIFSLKEAVLINYFWNLDQPECDSMIECRLTFIQPMKWLGFNWRKPSIYDDLVNENATSPPRPTHVPAQGEPEGNQTVTRNSCRLGNWSAMERGAELASSCLEGS